MRPPASTRWQGMDGRPPAIAKTDVLAIALLRTRPASSFGIVSQYEVAKLATDRYPCMSLKVRTWSIRSVTGTAL
jgi:hypothetical protein